MKHQQLPIQVTEQIPIKHIKTNHIQNNITIIKTMIITKARVAPEVVINNIINIKIEIETTVTLRVIREVVIRVDSIKEIKITNILIE